MDETNAPSNKENAASRPAGRAWKLGLIIPLTALLPIWFFFIGPQLRHDRLVENGVQVQGRLIDVEETGTVVNDSPELELTVEFTRKDGVLDTGSTDFVPSRRSLHYFQPDVAVTVAYDPEDPEELTIVDLNTAPVAAPAQIVVPQVSTAAANRAVDSVLRVNDSLKRAMEAMEARLNKLEERMKK